MVKQFSVQLTAQRTIMNTLGHYGKNLWWNVGETPFELGIPSLGN